MGLIGELILGALLEKEAVEFRSRKSLLLYAICRNLVEFTLIALFAAMVWWATYKGGLTNYFIALFLAALLLTRLVLCFLWNRKAIRQFSLLKRKSKGT